MKYHKVLNSDRSFVINLIDEINESFNNYIKNHEYFDFVSKFYVEFLGMQVMQSLWVLF